MFVVAVEDRGLRGFPGRETVYCCRNCPGVGGDSRLPSCRFVWVRVVGGDLQSTDCFRGVERTTGAESRRTGVRSKFEQGLESK